MTVLCAVTACSQAFEDVSNNKKKQETTKGRLVMKVGSKSRTILPDVSIVESDIKTARLTANGTEIKSWSGSGIIEQIENEDNILLDVGIYDFEMTFYNENGGVLLISTIDDKEIKAGDNFIIFDMKVPVTGNGNIAIELNWEADDRISIVRAGLYDVETDEVISAYKSEKLQIVGTQAIYFKENVPAGQYIIKFEIYNDTDKLLNTLTDVIKVIGGITTTEQKILNKVNTLYTITYNLNGGSWKAGFTPVTMHNANTGIVLPTADKVEKTNYVLLYWYDENGNKVTQIPSNTARDITMTAKWGCTANTVGAVINALSGTGPHDITVTGAITNYTISSIKTALLNKSYAKVNLDLSETTELTSIGSSAFKDCSKLTSVVIPDSVTSIGGWAFYNCSSLESVVIPDSVTSIGDYAFQYCSSLTSVVIGDSVTSIGSSAFKDCSNLTSVVIGDSVTSIGDSAFSNCSSLESVYITDLTAWMNIKFSSSYANPLSNGAKLYLNGSLVTDLVIPDSVTSIGDYAFEGCDSLTSVMIPDSVTSIGSSAFYNCSSLTSVTFKDTNNWSYTSNSDYTGGTAVDVTNTAQNATYLKSNKCWYKYSETTVTVTADNVTDAISKLSKGGNHTVKVTGAITADIITSIKTALNNNFSAYVNLDLSDTIGLTSIGNSAFYNCSSLTSVVIPDGVTSIGEYAFRYCSSLTKVIIPDSVTSIGYYAFEGCDSLESVYITDLTAWMNIKFSSYANPLSNGAKLLYLNGNLVTDLVIPYSVTSIDEYAFNGCSSLASVTISNSVTSIGSYAFNGCNNLTSVTISNSVTSIGERAFSGCNNLTSVIIPDGVTSIGSGAFSNCSSLTKVTIPDGVTSIGSYAFYGCSSLTKVTIPDGVTSIGERAFSGCDSLASVTIGDSVTSIGNYAFFGCSSLASVVISDSVTSIGDMTFYNCSSLTSVTFKDTNNWYYTSNSDYTGGTAVDVTNTAQNATYLKSTYDDKYWYKYSETTVTVTADNVTDAISKLSKGGNHTIKVTGAITADIITSISIVLNNNFSAYVNLDLSDTTGLTSIGYDAFKNCTGLTSVTIPDSVTTIGGYAFESCTGLTSVTIPNSVTTIGRGAFIYCSSLESVVIPDSVTSIGGSAFYNCSSLASVVIGDCVTSIDEYAFNGCSNLASVTIPNSVTSIGSYAFSGCSNLASVVIPDSVTSIGYYAFEGCDSLTSVMIPDGVTSIGGSAFYNCSSLASVVIGDSVTSIGDRTFEDCSRLTSVTIPDSVTFIGDRTFEGCSRLTTVNYKGSQEQWGQISIGNSNSYLTNATINYNYSGE